MLGTVNRSSMGVWGYFKALETRWRQNIGFHPMQFWNHWFTTQCSVKVKRALATTVLAKFCRVLKKSTIWWSNISYGASWEIPSCQVRIHSFRTRNMNGICASPSTARLHSSSSQWIWMNEWIWTKDLESRIIPPGNEPQQDEVLAEAKSQVQQSWNPYLSKAVYSSSSTHPTWLFCILQTRNRIYVPGKDTVPLGTFFHERVRALHGQLHLAKQKQSCFVTSRM